MKFPATILTHESIVHAQIVSLEKLLKRELTYRCTLNVLGTRSTLEISVSTEEMELIKQNLGYKISPSPDSREPEV